MFTMGAVPERNAKWYGGFDAMIDEKRRLTHAQYYDRISRLADGLVRLGARHQDRIGILAMNRLEYYELYGACEVSGLMIAPINFRLAVPEMVYIVRDSSPTVLVFEAQYAEAVAQMRGQIDSVKQYVCIDGPVPDWAVGFEDVVASGSPDGPPFRARPEDYLFLFYTSGTTGRPKGVISTHAGICQGTQISAIVTDFGQGSRILQTTPAFHTGGKGYLTAVSWVGGCSVIHQGFEPVKVLETIQKERITFTFMVAAMVQALLDVPNVEKYDVSSMQKIVSAAAPIPAPLLKRAIELLGPIFSIQYGGTEIGTGTYLPTHLVRADGPPEQLKRLASVGMPGPGVQMRVVDEKGNDCPPGVPGEVLFKSVSLMHGYWNNTAATKEAMRDGWYATGDVGYLDDDNYLFLVDRKKDMIISGGENIYSREVEEAIHQHAAVQEAAVIGVPDPKWVETVKAVVVLKPGSQIDEVALIEHCRTLIARYKCPKSIDFVDALPRVTTGKIDKVTLRNRYR